MKSQDAGSDISDAGDNLQRQLLLPEAARDGAGGGQAEGNPDQVHSAREGHPRLLGRALRPLAHGEEEVPTPLARSAFVKEIFDRHHYISSGEFPVIFLITTKCIYELMKTLDNPNARVRT